MVASSSCSPMVDQIVLISGAGGFVKPALRRASLSSVTNSSRSFHSHPISPVRALRIAACSPGLSFSMLFWARTSSILSSVGVNRSCSGRSTVMVE